MSDLKAIDKYYSSTQFEYKLVWNWGLKTTPALHFGYYDDKATNHAEAIVRANEALADYAEIKNGTTIIDAGCGLGHSAIWLSKRYHAYVTGITIVSKQVETIKKNLQNEPVENVEFLLADYMHMPFKDNSQDVVWAFESVCAMQSRKMIFIKNSNLSF